MAKSNGTPMQKRARAANQTAQKVQAAANRARRQVEPAAERPGIGEDGGARPQQVPSTDSSGRAAGTATGGGGSGGGGAPGATKSAGQTRRRQDKIMPNGARKLKKGKKSVHVGVSGAGAGSAQKSDGECSDTAGVFDMTDSDDDECLPSRGKRRVKSGAATPRATSGYRTLPAVKRARNGSTGGGGSQESPSSNKKRKGGDPPATVAATLASPVATGVLSQQSPNKGHSSSGGGGGGGGGTTSSRNTSSGSSSSGGRNGAESCGSAAMEPSVDDQGGPDEEEGTGSAGARTDAVLAPAAPNTPPRGKGKGKGKARRTTGRGAPSVTPTAPHDVDSEGRTASGNDNIGLGLEQAQFQLEEAIWASCADGGGPEGGSSSVGCTSSTNFTGAPALDEACQHTSTSAAATEAAPPKKRQRKSEGGGGISGDGTGGGRQRRKRTKRGAAAPAAAAAATTASITGSTTSSRPTRRTRRTTSGGGSSGGGGGGGGGKTASSIYRYSEENETVVLSRIANIKLDAPGVLEKLLLEVRRLQNQLRAGGIGLLEALRLTFGHVGTRLLDSAEGMPLGVKPTFLDERYSLPGKGAEVILVGLLCGAHDDHVAHTGRTDNRTSLCARELELAMGRNEGGALPNFLYVNAYTLRCMKTGNSYSDPCATDEDVLRFSAFCRAILYGCLHAHGVTARRLIQGCGGNDASRGAFHLGAAGDRVPGALEFLGGDGMETRIAFCPHWSATITNQSLHPALAAAVLGLIVQAFLGECTPELSEAGKNVFRGVVAGMRDTSYPLGFQHPPDYVRLPSASTDSSASTREAAKTQLVRDLEDAVLREPPSLSADTAKRLVARIFSQPSTEEASAAERAAKEANARAVSNIFAVSELEGVKNSGVEGTALSSVIGVETWAVFEFESLFQRGADNPVLPHTWHLDSLFFPSPSDDLSEGGANSGGGGGGGGGGGHGKVATPTLANVLDGDAARRRLGLGLFLDRHGLTDGSGETQSGHRKSGHTLSVGSEAVCRETVQAAVGAGAVRAVVAMGSDLPLRDGERGLLEGWEEEWRVISVTTAARKFLVDGYGNSFRFGDQFYSSARVDLVVHATAPLEKSSCWSVRTANRRTAHRPWRMAGLRAMGSRGGLAGAGDDAVFACFWSRFAGMSMLLESLFGPPPAFGATLAGALHQHGAATVVSSMMGTASIAKRKENPKKFTKDCQDGARAPLRKTTIAKMTPAQADLFRAQLDKHGGDESRAGQGYRGHTSSSSLSGGVKGNDKRHMDSDTGKSNATRPRKRHWTDNAVHLPAQRVWADCSTETCEEGMWLEHFDARHHSVAVAFVHNLDGRRVTRNGAGGLPWGERGHRRGCSDPKRERASPRARSLDVSPKNEAAFGCWGSVLSAMEQ